jgi:hypothetical protein
MPVDTPAPPAPAPAPALPPPPPVLDPRPSTLQSRWLGVLFGGGVLLVLAGLALQEDAGLLLQRAGCFLATYAVLIGAAWLPSGVLSRRIDSLVERWVRNSSGGFYGVMALSVFLQLEAFALVRRIVEFEPSLDELRNALIQHLIGFSQDSIMSVVWGMAWPGRLLRDHGGTATAALAVAAWLVFRLSQRIVPHVGLQKRASAPAKATA